jgi:hypothetical protein
MLSKNKYFLLLLLTPFITNLQAIDVTEIERNDNCTEKNIISELSNITTNKNINFKGSSKSGEDEAKDYFSFIPSEDKITYISITGTEENNSKFYLKIGTNGCDTNNIYGITKASNHNINEFKVLPNTPVDIYVKGSGWRSIDNYNLNIDIRFAENNYSPIIQNDFLNFSILETTANDRLITKIEVTDKDRDTVLTYNISNGNEDNAFKIDNDGNLKINDTSKIIFANKNQYILTIEVSDGVHTVSENFTINILEDNRIIYNETSSSTNDACGGEEIITPLNNIDEEKTVYLIGDSLSGENDEYDYYKFKIGYDGTIKINGTEENNSYYYIRVGTDGCSSDNIYDERKREHNINEFSVKKDETVYLRIKGSSDTRNRDYYKLKIDYEPAFGLPGDNRTGYAGPEGTIGYIERETINNDKSQGTILLVDDDKIECPNAQYTNLLNVFDVIETQNIQNPTIVMCKGNYNAPTATIEAIPNLTITSNYNEANGTIVNGGFKFKSISNLTISYIDIESGDNNGINIDYSQDIINLRDLIINSNNMAIFGSHIDNSIIIENSKLFSKNNNTISLEGFGNSISEISNVLIGNNEENTIGGVGISLGIDNVKMNNLSIYSHEASLKILNSPNTELKNSILFNNTEASIVIQNSNNAIIDNSKLLSNTGYGVNIIQSLNTQITSSVIEAFQNEALNLTESNGGYFQNNCFSTNNRVYDIKIAEDMNDAIFDNGYKGNFYNNAQYIDNNNDNINDYPFYIVVNHNKTYIDNKPQIGCNYGLYNPEDGKMFLETMKDLNPSDNIVEDNAVIGTSTKITAYTKNSLSIGSNGNKEKVNLILIADVSGSMYNANYGGIVTLSDGTVTTKKDVLEESLKLLVEKYSQIADVKYDLIQFSGSIDKDTGWTDIETTPVPDLVKGGGTDYYDALTQAMDVSMRNLPSADKTIVYFMSDGSISQNETAFYSDTKIIDTDGNGRNDSSFLEWWFKSVVMNPDIYKTYTYGILESNEDLDAVSIIEEGYKTPDPILMETPEDILKELLKTLDYIIDYSLVDDYNGAFYIDQYSGEIFVKDSSLLNIDIDKFPTIIAKGTDSLNNLSIEKEFIIQLEKGIDNGVSTEECNVFADALQTRKENCLDTEGINWENEAVIKNNPDNELNTCNLNLKTYLEQNGFKTCDTEICIKSQTTGKTIGINYENNAEIVTLETKPSNAPSNVDRKFKNQTENLNFSYLDELITKNSTLNVDLTNIANINLINKIAINYIKTDNSIINFVPNQTADIEIGYLTKKYNGKNNTITTNENVNNLKINSLTLTGNTNIDFKAQTAIKMNNMSLGRGGIINLTAPIVTINTTDLTNYGSGTTYINIKADVINMNTLELGQNYILKVEPYTPDNKLLFRANDVIFESSSIMKLGNGYYYINNSLIIPGMSNGESIEAIDENQDIDIYINNDLYLGNNPAINAKARNGEYGDLPAENFKIFINGDFRTGGGGTTINGLVYVEGNADLGSPTFINGALSANSTITLNQGSEIIYDRGILNTKYGACPAIATAKPVVSFFKAWDKDATDNTIGVKIVNQPFELNIASLSDETTNLNVEFNAWLQDIETGEVLTLPKLSFNQKINDVATKSFKITGAYKDVHMMFQICSDYDATTNEYKLYNFESCERTCNYDLEITDGEPCVRTVQGQEGFAVRPNTFDVKIYTAGTLNSGTPDLLDNTNNLISGKTYKAGEDFDIEVKALDINGDIVSNFNEDFNIEITKANNNMIVDGDFIPNTSNTENNSMTFKDGELSFSGSYSEVGIINIKVTPNEDFASIDASVSDRNYIIPSITFQAGRFIPYAFEIENINLKDIEGNNNINRVNGCKYNYLNETSKDLTNLKYSLTINAINKNGDITKNYDGDFAKETDVSFDVNWKNISSANITGHENMSDTFASILWTEGTYTTPNGYEFVQNIDILSSIGVDRKNPFEPFGVSLKDETNIYTNNFNITDNEVTNTTDLGNRSFDITALRPDILYYVYGRINPIDTISIPGGNAKASIYYELYSDTNKNTLKTILDTTNLKESVNDSKWWRNTKHKTCDTVLAEDLDISFNTLNTNIVAGSFDYTNDDKDIIEIENTSLKRPIDTTVTIKFDTSNSFLFHDSYSNIKESRFNIRFIGNISNINNKVDVINNIGKNTANQSRFIR